LAGRPFYDHPDCYAANQLKTTEFSQEYRRLASALMLQLEMKRTATLPGLAIIGSALHRKNLGKKFANRRLAGASIWP